MSSSPKTIVKSSGKQWEGQVAGGKFRLQQFVGSSAEGSMVFLTELQAPSPQRAVIKLAALDPARAQSRLTEWSQAATLSHPNILQIFDSGRCQLGEQDFLFVVMEYAEESLADVLPQRRLSPLEAQEMLPPVVDALTYLHAQDLVHGRLKPANVMAAGDQVKLSADSIRSASNLATAPAPVRTANPYDAPELASGAITPAADVWSLGMTLSEVTGVKPLADDAQEAGGSESFAGMMRRCLEPDPRRRWTVRDIAQWLSAPPSSQEALPATFRPGEESHASPVPQMQSLSKWLGLAVAIAAVALLAFIGLRSRPSHPGAASVDQASTNSNSQPATQTATPRPVEPVIPPARAAKSAPASSEAIRNRVLPDIPRSARRTITGHIRVDVKVAVDTTGSVVRSNMETSGPSQYFARKAREAAGQWTFSPAQVEGHIVPSEWMLHFSFSRNATDVRPVRVAP